MKKLYGFVVAIMAIATMAFAASSASAVTVSPGGNITASFGSGGMTFATIASTTLCPVVFEGNIGTSGSGSITNATVNGGSPCLGVRYTFTFPWSVAVTYGSPLATIVVSGITVIADISGLRCTFTGSVTLGVANPGGRINAPVGTLTGPCGNATIGGTGGTLSPTQTVTP